MKLPELTITKAMYNEAKQMEKIRKDIGNLDTDFETKIQLSREVGDLIEKQEDYFFNRISAYNIVKEYERREKNTEIPFVKLLETNRNTYRFILQNGTSFESKFFYCKYNKDLKKAKVLTETPTSPSPVSFDTLEGDFQEVICTERNNNLDFRNNEWWTEKLATYLEDLTIDKINKL